MTKRVSQGVVCEGNIGSEMDRFLRFAHRFGKLFAIAQTKREQGMGASIARLFRQRVPQFLLGQLVTRLLIKQQGSIVMGSHGMIHTFVKILA